MTVSTPDDFMLLIEAINRLKEEAIVEGQPSPPSVFSPVRDDPPVKGRAIKLQISKEDIDALRAMAAAEGISYQSLITRVLNDYVDNPLAEISAVTMMPQLEEEA